MARARRIMDHPRVQITDLEDRLGTRYTAQTLRCLTALNPRVQFVWLMGADNLAQLHRWQDWHYIMETVPVGVLARPGERIAARRSVAAQRYAHARLQSVASQQLARTAAPCWCYINLPLSSASSTAIRARGGWTGSE